MSVDVAKAGDVQLSGTFNCPICGVASPHTHSEVERTGRDANGVPRIVGLGDGTMTSDGTFIPA